MLQEEIEHHVEEEEKRMEACSPRRARRELDLDALGEQLAARKQELTEQSSERRAEPELTTMDEVSV